MGRCEAHAGASRYQAHAVAPAKSRVRPFPHDASWRQAEGFRAGLHLPPSLEALPPQAVEPARRASARPLHTTVIRNEAAYFGCVAQLLADHPPPPLATPAGSHAPLYLCGDSHCLSGAASITLIP